MHATEWKPLAGHTHFFTIWSLPLQSPLKKLLPMSLLSPCFSYLSNTKPLEVIKILQCISYNIQYSLCYFCLEGSYPLLYLANSSKQIKNVLEVKYSAIPIDKKLPCHIFQINFVCNSVMKISMLYCKCSIAFLLRTELWFPRLHNHPIFSLYLHNLGYDLLAFSLNTLFEWSILVCLAVVGYLAFCAIFSIPLCACHTMFYPFFPQWTWVLFLVFKLLL